jgi:hypothetical protein
MNRINKIKLIGLGLILLIPIFARAQSIPAFPMSFWGNATINGNSAPAGTIIRAYYGTVLAGQVTLSEDGIYGYDEPTKQKLVVGEGSGTITFTVQSPSINSGVQTNGLNPPTYTGFVSSAVVHKDLDFTITQPANTSSLGGGGGGGGGGVGGVYIPLTTSTAVQFGDINGDGKVDKYDFAIMMSQWGEAGLNLSADLNHDGKVDKYDFAILMSQWGL